ncbi:MAG: EthD family reductase [Candidatus Rokubacteria bacterium]|nr:EthD family reductase [Candidatus Rokubacteria bacterium]
MVKLVAMYGMPRDPRHFDRYYRDVHVPLARKIPDLRRFTIHKVVGSPQEGESPYYCLTEVYWDDLPTAHKALASPGGRASYNDVPNYATGGVTFVFAEVEDIPLSAGAPLRGGRRPRTAKARTAASRAAKPRTRSDATRRRSTKRSRPSRA